MKKIILILLTISTLSTFAFANVGKITALKGEVYVQRAAEQKTATIGLILELDDKIITKKKSKALILFNDNTSITIGKSSNMDIKSFVYDQKVASNNKAEFGFGQGVFRTITGKIGKLNKSKFKIKTSTASIGIRGTVFDVVVNDKGVPDVGVLDGAVALSFTEDMQNEFTDQEIVVGKGQSIVYDDQAPVGERFKVQDKPLPQTDHMNQEFKTLSSEQEQNGEGQNEDKKKETTEKKTIDNQKNEVVKKEAAKQETTPTEKQNNEETPVENKDQGETPPPQENQKPQVVQQPEQEPVPIEDNIQPQEQLPPQEETPSVENDFSDVNVRGLDTEVRNFDTPDIVEVEDQKEDTDTSEENDPAAPQTDETDTPTPTDAPEVTDTPDVTETPEVVDIEDIPATDTIDEVVQGVEETTVAVNDVVDTATEVIQEPVVEEPVVENINNNPTLSVVNSLSTNEDVAGSLSFTTNDIDNDTLTTSAVASKGSVTIANGEITYTPNANFNGTDTITLSVDDGNGGVIEQTISINVTAVNDNPTLSVVNSLSTNEDVAGSLSFTTNDIDNDTLTTSAVASKGSVTIANGEITYTPNANFNGTDTITLSVDDGAGGVITENITVTINSILDEAEVVNTMPSYSQDIQAITNKIMNTNSDTYMEFGFIATDPQDISTATDTYFTGDLTPSEVISGYISTSQTASYTGGLSAIVDGTASTGIVSLDVNFGTQNFTGDIDITQGNWDANINSGIVNPYGFNSTDITGTSDYGSIISGDMTGKFYGPAANSVGGGFNLSTSTNKASGVFGGKK